MKAVGGGRGEDGGCTRKCSPRGLSYTCLALMGFRYEDRREQGIGVDLISLHAVVQYENCVVSLPWWVSAMKAEGERGRA